MVNLVDELSTIRELQWVWESQWDDGKTRFERSAGLQGRFFREQKSWPLCGPPNYLDVRDPES